MKVSGSFHRLGRVLRAAVGMLAGMVTYPIAWCFLLRAQGPVGSGRFGSADGRVLWNRRQFPIRTIACPTGSPRAGGGPSFSLLRISAIGAIFLLWSGFFTCGPARPMLAVDHEGGSGSAVCAPGHGDLYPCPLLLARQRFNSPLKRPGISMRRQVRISSVPGSRSISVPFWMLTIQTIPRLAAGRVPSRPIPK